MADPYSALVADVTGLDVRCSAEIAGGRSGALKLRIETGRNELAFVKIAMPDAEPRVHELVRREAEIARQLAHAVPAPRFIGFRTHRGATALSSAWVSGGAADTWQPDAALQALRALFSLHEKLRARSYSARPMVAEERRFRTFHRLNAIPRSTALGPDRVEWVDGHRPLLVELERIGRDEMEATHLIHCDLAADNVILSVDAGPMFVDWGHARLGNQEYDLAAFLIRVFADNAWSPQLDELLASRQQPRPHATWAAMLTLCTGMFLERSRGETDRPSLQLSEQRARYVRAGIDLLRKVTA